MILPEHTLTPTQTTNGTRHAYITLGSTARRTVHSRQGIAALLPRPNMSLNLVKPPQYTQPTTNIPLPSVGLAGYKTTPPPTTSRLLFSCDRPEQCSNMHSNSYGQEKLRVLLGIDERIQNILIRVLKKFIEEERSVPQDSKGPHLRAREPRGALCERLNCVQFPDEVVDAVREGAATLRHDPWTTGFYMYRTYMTEIGRAHV